MTDKKKANTIGTTRSDASFNPPITITTQLRASKNLNPLLIGNFKSVSTYLDYSLILRIAQLDY